jgi:hypothetical protein
MWDVGQRSIGDPEIRQCPKCGSYEIEETKASNVAQPNACAQLADVLAEFEPMIFDFVESHNEGNVRMFLKGVLGKYFS